MNSRVKIYKDDDSRVTLIAENQNCLHKVLQGTSKLQHINLMENHLKQIYQIS